MMLAMEPRIVRFPASVLDMASASQDVCGSGRCGTTRVKSITAGTLLVRFESTAATMDSPHTDSTPIGRSRSKKSRSRPTRSMPATTTKRPMKSVSNPQSMRR